MESGIQIDHFFPVFRLAAYLHEPRVARIAFSVYHPIYGFYYAVAEADAEAECLCRVSEQRLTKSVGRN